jgi:hypothetical protein
MGHSSTRRAPVTPEAITLLEGYGFATVYDADGNVVQFLQRDLYDRAVAEGQIKPRTPPPKNYPLTGGN